MTIEDISKQKGWNLAFLKAIASVESSGEGLVPDLVTMTGRPKVRFEPHKFNKKSQLKMPFTDGGKGFSKIKSETNWNAFCTALKIDRELAIASTSFGMFQIMGFNWKTAGAKSLEDFFKGNYSEDKQLEYFSNFVGSHAGRRKILERSEITLADCVAFAKSYNGPSNADAYGKKIWAAYNKHKETA